MKLKIISRKSTLARIQAQCVAQKISKLDSTISIEYILKETQGDIDLLTPLNQMPDMGVFTSDIKKELLKGNADIAIHSWKDLPVELEPGTEIIGTIERADMRDMLFLKKTSRNNKIQNIYSSSPRREKNLNSFFQLALPISNSKTNFINVRGNILTRFNKLQDSQVDGLVVAKAAIDRLIQDATPGFNGEKKELQKIIKKMLWMIIPLSVNPCAAAQGALAIEAKSDNYKIKELIQKISNKSIFNSVQKEREILKSYGGGCHQKIGVSIENNRLGEVRTIKGESEDSKELNIRSFTPHLGRGNYFEGINKDSIYPKYNEKNTFFKRKTITSVDDSIKRIRNEGIYVSRSNALNNNITIEDSNIVWTSGIETWIKLAKAGNWINGSSDSLGEEECPEESPFKKVEWSKLSHNLNISSQKKIISTYELLPLEIDPSISKRTHFFWMSSTSFKRAIELYPEILNANHATGIGKSFDIIQSIIPQKVEPFLDYQDWLNQVEANCPPSL